MSDLTEFLLARIAEDRRGAQDADALTECDEREEIVKAYLVVGRLPDVPLRHLALPYADHPDYREEWKP